MTQVYEMARMSPLIRGLTLMLLMLPPLFLGIGLFGGGPAAGVMLVVGCLLVVLFIVIYAYSRPSRFEITPDAVAIVWPIRRATLRRADIVRARDLDLAAFRSEYGVTVRIGAGGLFGTFGWLYSRSAGLLDVYVSTLGPWVVIERKSGRPLIISPERPEAFVAELCGEGAASVPEPPIGGGA